MPLIQPVTDYMQDVYDEAALYDIDPNDLENQDLGAIGFIVVSNSADDDCYDEDEDYIIPYGKMTNVNGTVFTWLAPDGVLLTAHIDHTKDDVRVVLPTGDQLDLCDHVWAPLPESEFVIGEEDCDM